MQNGLGWRIICIPLCGAFKNYELRMSSGGLMGVRETCSPAAARKRKRERAEPATTNEEACVTNIELEFVFRACM